MADFGKLPGGVQPTTLEQIGEIVKGATIKSITRKMRDPEHGGECVAIELQGGDALVFIAVPAPKLVLSPDAPTAVLQPMLVRKRFTRLKV